jgi:hypothetical protein
MNTLDCPGTRRLDESGTFFESSKDSNLGFPFLHSIGVGVAGPGKRGSGTESLVSPGEGSVDDILAVSADGDKSAVGTVVVPRSRSETWSRWPSSTVSPIVYQHGWAIQRYKELTLGSEI